MEVDVLSKEYLIAVCACESVAIKTDRQADGRTDRQTGRRCVSSSGWLGVYMRGSPCVSFLWVFKFPPWWSGWGMSVWVNGVCVYVSCDEDPSIHSSSLHHPKKVTVRLRCVCVYVCVCPVMRTHLFYPWLLGPDQNYVAVGNWMSDSDFWDMIAVFRWSIHHLTARGRRGSLASGWWGFSLETASALVKMLLVCC